MRWWRLVSESTINILWFVLECCSVLQHRTLKSTVYWHASMCCGVLRCAAVCCSTTRRNLQSTATPRAESHVYNTLPHAVTRCNTLQHTSTHSHKLNTLQHTATPAAESHVISSVKSHVIYSAESHVIYSVLDVQKNKITTPPFP